MASFNSWNGMKSHGNEYLLNNILKSQMEFDGFIVGDWMAMDKFLVVKILIALKRL